MAEFDSYQIIDGVINISSSERSMNKDINEVILDKIRQKYGNKYTEYGYINGNNIKIVTYSKPYLKGSHFHAGLTIDVKFRAKVCLPKKNEKLIARVTHISRPYISIQSNKIIGLIPKVTSSNTQYSNISINNKIETIIENVSITDKGIICICKEPKIFSSEEQLILIETPDNVLSVDELNVEFAVKPEIINKNISHDNLIDFYNKYKPVIDTNNILKLNEIKDDYFSNYPEGTTQFKIIEKYNYKYTYISKGKTHNVIEFDYVTKAHLKMTEILNVLNINKVFPEKINICCLAEGPGSFIQSIRNYRMDNNGNTIIDSINGWTIIDKNDRLNWDKKILDFEDLTLNKTNGNLMDYDYIRDEIGKLNGKKFNFITADGTIETESYQLMELDNFNLILGEVVMALNVQEKNGIFVFKVHDTYFNSTINLIKLLYSFYSKIEIYKPYTSPQNNSEKYIICSGFISENLTEHISNKLFDILKSCTDNNDKYLYSLSFINPNIDNFIISLQSINSNRINEQISSISNYDVIVDYLKNNKVDQIKNIITSNILLCKLWLNKFNIPYNEESLTNLKRKLINEINYDIKSFNSK